MNLRKIIIAIVYIFIFLFSFNEQGFSKNIKHNDSPTNLNIINVPFWKKFNDEVLLNSILMVYQNNNDLKISQNKIKEAQRIVKISLSNELPYIGFDGYINRTFHSSDEYKGDFIILDYHQSRFLLPLTMNFELDIWGQNRLKTKAKKKELLMLEEDQRAFYISIISSFAINYYNLVKIDKLIDVQNKLINNQKQILNAYKDKEEFGTAIQNDIIREEKKINILNYELNDLKEKQEVLQNQLKVYLSDRSFDKINRIDFENINFDPKIPNKIEFSQLEQRPDYKKVQHKIEKIGLDVKIAKRDFLPKFTILGTLGFNAYQFNNIFSKSSRLVNLGVMPSLDIFDGGRKFQILKINKYRYDSTINEYEKIILASIQETNDALYNLKSTHENLELALKRYNLDNEDLYLINKKINYGIANNIDLFKKQEELLLSEKHKISIKVNEIISYINLYKALGGVEPIENL